MTSTKFQYVNGIKILISTYKIPCDIVINGDLWYHTYTYIAYVMYSSTQNDENWEKSSMWAMSDE